MIRLHIDIETYSSEPIREAGLYKYAESLDFEILIFAYAYNDEPVRVVELARGELIPEDVREDLTDRRVQKWAHNATFERVCIEAGLGVRIPIEQIYCSAIKAASCGLPLSLAAVSAALKLGDKAKDRSGAALIRYFSVPIKPTKVNGGRVRNLPEHDPQRWSQFVAYCAQDVEAERAICEELSAYEWTRAERENYIVNELINDRGVRIDREMAREAIMLDDENKNNIINRLREITQLANPNSPAQLKSWLSDRLKNEINSLSKDIMPELQERAEALGDIEALEVLQLRAQGSRTSVKKYAAMIAAASEADDRARGLFQFYGAYRTGRWAGRIIQLQNLPRNKVNDLALARWLVTSGDADGIRAEFGSVSDILSQVIRTALVPSGGKMFVVADYSAIEARVIAWLAGEAWREEVFASHGRIYEASAAQMFGVPVESIGKGSPLRAKGKIAELALGYGGSTGALAAMGAEAMGLAASDMKGIVNKWRRANTEIVHLWSYIELAAKRAIRTRKEVVLPLKHTRLIFNADDYALRVKLPSGRELFYKSAYLGDGKWGGSAIYYKGADVKTHKWGDLETYGGKLTENIVQAIARDLLAEALRALEAEKYATVAHVHDEVIVEVSAKGSGIEMEKIEGIMARVPDWGKGLVIPAEGFVTEFYKKD